MSRLARPGWQRGRPSRHREPKTSPGDSPSRERDDMRCAPNRNLRVAPATTRAGCQQRAQCPGCASRWPSQTRPCWQRVALPDHHPPVRRNSQGWTVAYAFGGVRDKQEAVRAAFFELRLTRRTSIAGALISDHEHDGLRRDRHSSGRRCRRSAPQFRRVSRPTPTKCMALHVALGRMRRGRTSRSVHIRVVCTGGWDDVEPLCVQLSASTNTRRILVDA